MRLLLTIIFVLCCSVATFADSSLLADIAAKRAAQPLETTTEPVKPPAPALALEILNRRAKELLDTSSFSGAGAGGRIPGTPFFTNLWYARTDGGTTSRCTGLVNAADPGSGTAQPCAYASLQNAIDAVVAGDTVSARAGDTWDGTLIIPNKSCTSGSPCIVKSSALASLPAGRVGPANASNMPRLRTTGGGQYGGVIQMSTNADYWTFDGFELTDNGTNYATIAFLVDSSNSTVDNLTVKHCYFHQKETGTSYNRTVQRGIQFEGDTLTFQYNYVYLIGYYYPEVAPGGSSTYQMDTTTLLMVGEAKNVLMEDNYSSVWWNQIFTGGADSDPQNSANLTSATTGSATFDNTTGLAAGVMLRLEFTTVGTFNSTGIGYYCGNGAYPAFPANPPPTSTGTQIVRTSGYALQPGAEGAGDEIKYGKIRNAGDAYDLLIGVCTVSGNNIMIARTRSTSTPTNGTVTLTTYETAIVTSVVGSTVNYTPYGLNALGSSGATKASWNYSGQGLVSDITVRKNTFYNDPVFAHQVYLDTGNSPKGLVELKNINRLTFEGNYVLGYPMIFGVYPGNQYGTAPWTAAKHIIIRNNWFATDLGYPESTRDALYLVDASNYATVAPNEDLQVYNNLIKNVHSFSSFKGYTGASVYHNTVINTGPTLYGYDDAITHIGGGIPITGWDFRNNIVAFHSYGAQCYVVPYTQAACWPSGVWLNNVVVADSEGGSGTLHCGASSEWGNGANLCPKITAFSSVGFTNLAGDIYSLTGASSYYHGATDGTDPGVDWPALLTALGSAPPGGTQSTIGGRVTVQGRVTIH